MLWQTVSCGVVPDIRTAYRYKKDFALCDPVVLCCWVSELGKAVVTYLWNPEHNFHTTLEVTFFSSGLFSRNPLIPLYLYKTVALKTMRKTFLYRNKWFIISYLDLQKHWFMTIAPCSLRFMTKGNQVCILTIIFVTILQPTVFISKSETRIWVCDSAKFTIFSNETSNAATEVNVKFIILLVQVKMNV